ncbi:hypothetical protein DB354_13395 [Opitutus sp. ER46]|nr:hypothetical protein DB354_13395 [Opitutus sp. ER46]
MTILTLSKKNTIKLPKDIVQLLRGARHLHVKPTASGFAVTAVQIQPAINFKSIPDNRAISVK